MPKRVFLRLNATLERWLPEQRLFLKSDSGTRFLRLRPMTQAAVLGGTALVFGWSVIATSILLIDGISSGSSREQTQRAEIAFEQRLNTLSQERDTRATEAAAAQDRFALALGQVSRMQSALLVSEERRRELETGIEVIQATLRRAMSERDDARSETALLMAEMNGGHGETRSHAGMAEDALSTLEMVSAALGATAAERDEMQIKAEAAEREAHEIALDKRLMEQRNDEIFATLEGAVNISLEPLDKMFSAVGMNPDTVIEQVRRGYSGQGGPLTPISFSTKGNPAITNEEARANEILEALDRLNLYRLAVEKLPFDMPVKAAHRFSSPFGQRWGRLHAGVDFAGPTGTPIESSADGTVTFAGWQSGYGNLIKIRHEFGIETRYAHLSQIRVKVGQKVSRGDRIGDMGNTGRSTGPHLHYEVRLGGSAVNPMTFIRAARDVF